MTTTRIPAPALLDSHPMPRWLRRGSTSEVLAGLRRLLHQSSPPAGAVAPRAPRKVAARWERLAALFGRQA